MFRIFLYFLLVFSVKAENFLDINKESLKLARETLEVYIKTKNKPFNISVLNTLPPKGLFVILKKGEKVRGCAGSFKPIYNTLGEGIVNFTIIASTQDIRYPPIKIDEIDEIKIMIIFPQEIIPIDSPYHFFPLKEGLIIKKSGKEGVVIPGEAKTVEYAIKIGMKNAEIDSLDGAIFYKFKGEILKEK